MIIATLSMIQDSKCIYLLTKLTFAFNIRIAVRSQSTKLVTEAATDRPANRRSLPLNVTEDEEMFALSEQLNSELKLKLENRASDLSSDRPESMTSSEASIHEVSAKTTPNPRFSISHLIIWFLDMHSTHLLFLISLLFPIPSLSVSLLLQRF